MKILTPDQLKYFQTLDKKVNQAKAVKDAACWNWALFGCLKDVAPVAMLFSYVYRDGDAQIQQVTRKEAEDDFAENKSKRWATLQAGQPLRKELDGIRTTYDTIKKPTKEQRNTIRDSVFALCVKVAGFEISSTATPYRIVMFEPTDVVMFDHWWLEIGGSTVETVTGQPLYANSDVYLSPAYNLPRDRFAGAGGSGLGAERAARVHARYVKKLHDKQVEVLTNNKFKA